MTILQAIMQKVNANKQDDCWPAIVINLLILFVALLAALLLSDNNHLFTVPPKCKEVVRGIVRDGILLALLAPGCLLTLWLLFSMAKSLLEGYSEEVRARDLNAVGRLGLGICYTLLFAMWTTIGVPKNKAGWVLWIIFLIMIVAHAVQSHVR